MTAATAFRSRHHWKEARRPLRPTLHCWRIRNKICGRLLTSLSTTLKSTVVCRWTDKDADLPATRKEGGAAWDTAFKDAVDDLCTDMPAREQAVLSHFDSRLRDRACMRRRLSVQMGDPVAILATEVSQFEGMRGACACLWPLELAISYFIKTSAKAKEIEGPIVMSHPGK